MFKVIRRLLAEHSGCYAAGALPKTIYFCWLQGLDDAPDLVRFNADRWRTLNPDWELRILAKRDADALLAGWPPAVAALPPAARSDCLRLHLLATEGGVWVDATTLPTVPLSHWLLPIMARQSFFAFERPGPDRLISSWFLASERSSPFLRDWLALAMDYWSTAKSIVDGIPDDPVAAISDKTAPTAPYYWLHYLFALMLSQEARLARQWKTMSKLAAGDAAALRHRFDLGQPGQAEVSALLAGSPVHKLNHRKLYDLGKLGVECMGFIQWPRKDRSMSVAMPPADVRYRVVNRPQSEAEYLEVGRDSVEAVLGVVSAASPRLPKRKARVLDFGCGCARTIQPLHSTQPDWVLYGTDIDDVTVDWSRQNVPSVHWNVNQGEPPLPYESEHFDLIYALSVFSHLDAGMEDRWLAELVRVLRPGGLIYVTFTGQGVLEKLPDAFPPHVTSEYRNNGFAYFSNIGDGILPDWYQTSLQTGAYMASRLPKGTRVAFHKIGGHRGFQDSLLIHKPANIVRRLWSRLSS